MGICMADTANIIYRDFATDGVPSSGKNRPKKREIRALLTGYETIINAFLSNGGLIFASKASLDGSLNYAANTMAWVLGDATVANNGIYRKIGGSGTGSWTRVADLPFSFIIASDVGAGTPNAIQATSSIPISGSALVWVNVFRANTAGPVTISFNSGAALTVKTNSGNDVAAGGLTAGMIVMGIVSGSTFRLISDQASSAIVAAAEAAKAAAEAAATSVNIKYALTRTALSALNTAVTTLSYLGENGREGVWEWVAGNFSTQIAADTQQGLYIKADAIAASAGAWVRVVLGIPSVMYFGAKGDGTTVDTGAFSAAFVMSKAVRVPIGTFLAEVVVPNGGTLVGDHRDLSVIKTPPGANKTAIQGFEAYVLFGSSVFDTSRGANNVVIRNLTVDGNRANVTTSGDGIAIWGYGTTVESVRIKNVRARGMKTEWTDGAVSMEGHFRDIVIDTVGENGWHFAGPHDSNVEDVIIIDAGQNADNTYNGLLIGSGGGASSGNGRFYNIHIWHRAGVANRCAYGLNSGGINEFVSSHFEGCRVNAAFRTMDIVSACRIYNVFGPNGGSMVHLLGSDVVIKGTIFQTPEGAAHPNAADAPNPDCFAIYLGVGFGGCKIDGKFIGFQKRTPFNFDASVGTNSFIGIGYASSGGATVFGGTVAASDAVDYVQGGTVINYRKPAPYGAYANDAGAAAGGVPINGLYRNSSTGALAIRVT